MIVNYKFEIVKRHRGKKEIEIGDAKPKVDRRKLLSASRAARWLALAHFIERAIAAGLLKDYADAARKIGVSRPRVAQIMNSMGIDPIAAERILTTYALREKQNSRWT